MHYRLLLPGQFFEEENPRELLQIKDGLYVVILALG